MGRRADEFRGSLPITGTYDDREALTDVGVIATIVRPPNFMVVGCKTQRSMTC